MEAGVEKRWVGVGIPGRRSEMFDSDFWPKWSELFAGRVPQAGAAETSQGFRKSGTKGTWASLRRRVCQQEAEDGLEKAQKVPFCLLSLALCPVRLPPLSIYRSQWGTHCKLRMRTWNELLKRA